MFPEPSLIVYGPASDLQIIVELIVLGLTLLLLRFAVKRKRKTVER